MTGIMATTSNFARSRRVRFGKRAEGGFSLVELMIAITVLAIEQQPVQRGHEWNDAGPDCSGKDCGRAGQHRCHLYPHGLRSQRGHELDGCHRGDGESGIRGQHRYQHKRNRFHSGLQRRSGELQDAVCRMWRRRPADDLRGAVEHSDHQREHAPDNGRRTAISSCLGGGQRKSGPAVCAAHHLAKRALP